MITLVEVQSFLAQAKRIWTETEVEELKDYLARYPEAGDIIKGARGLRKLRWGVLGRGKRGGARVVYYYHSADLPLFLLTAYAKNETNSLTFVERRKIARLVETLVAHYRGI